MRRRKAQLSEAEETVDTTEESAEKASEEAKVTGNTRSSRRSNRSGRRRADSKSEAGIGSVFKELGMVVIAALIISALIRAFVVQVFVIPSGSMENTLLPGDRILVSKLVPKWRDLNRGDVVVFTDTQGWLSKSDAASKTDFITKALVFIGLRPESSEQHVVKRIIGMPGDHVKCCNSMGQITVNGVAVNETGYIKPGEAPSDEPFDVTVPKGHLWLMGDNRAHSADSRFHLDDKSSGFVPIKDVVGRAFMIMYPFDRFGRVTTTKAFTGIPYVPTG